MDSKQMATLLGRATALEASAGALQTKLNHLACHPDRSESYRVTDTAADLADDLGELRASLADA
jgi:hypothetical protein